MIRGKMFCVPGQAFNVYRGDVGTADSPAPEGEGHERVVPQ